MKINILLAALYLLLCSVSSQTSRIQKQKNPQYTYDEIPKQHKCSNSDQCDGLRTCSQWGWCQGTARAPVTTTLPKNADYRYNEALTGNTCPEDLNYASRDYFCDGLRTCSQWGWCQGFARPPVTTRPPKNADYHYDEALTGNTCPEDPNYASRDYFCDGLRTCSQWGWCQGTAR